MPRPLPTEQKRWEDYVVSILMENRLDAEAREQIRAEARRRKKSATWLFRLQLRRNRDVPTLESIRAAVDNLLDRRPRHS